MRPGPRGVPACAARLAVLATALLAALGLAVPGPARRHRVGKDRAC